MISIPRIVVAVLAIGAAALSRPAAAPAQESLAICANQSVPSGYVVTSVQSRVDCPGYSPSRHNGYVIRLPGDNVAVCSAFAVPGEGYVVTSRIARVDCPNYQPMGTNSATYRRLPTATPAAGPVGAPMEPLELHESFVYERLAETADRLRLGAPTHRPWMAAAVSGATTRSQLRVQSGRRYTLIGACDADCTDLDLRVLDGTYVVAQDVGDDEHPRLEITPAQSGTLTVEVIMAACAQNPCSYGVVAHQTPELPHRPRPRQP